MTDREIDHQSLSPGQRAPSDTIAALATPPGRGGIGVVRVSGPLAAKIAEAVIGNLPRARHACYVPFRDGDGTPLDQGIALYFVAPNSFTGEDVLELQAHGGPVVLDLLLQRCLECGARLARPGEFSERAFLNDKLDLTQAEAIADLIESTTAQAARSALRSLRGAFSEAVETLQGQLIDLRVYVEAALDFPDEEIDFLADVELRDRVAQVVQRVDQVALRAQQGSLLREGLHLVIAGLPNAGKSSLLNALSGTETAIVTELAGTTRDVLRERIQVRGIPVHVIDTAGLRDSSDPIERIGIERAWHEIERADLVLHLIDATRGFTPEDADIRRRLPPRVAVLEVYNKIDLTGDPPGVDGNRIHIAVREGLGIEALREALLAKVGYHVEVEDSFMARRRHLDALEQARAAVLKAQELLVTTRAGELVAEELRLALDALGSITGRFTTDDLLERVFSSFCIGK
ncbi:MAG: tRNA uridine-5-carboxymethylaminomethyl(34) synthesis GTPase MnmE [Thiotrichales bacterium]